MPNYLSLFQSKQLATIQNKHFAKQLVALNDKTQEYGITLSASDCADIAEFRSEALLETERLEIGLGAAGRIIEEFCNDGYVDNKNFRQTVEDLLECFYTIKTETDDRANDDQVMEFLHYLFDTVLGGDTSKIYETEELDNFISSFFEERKTPEADSANEKHKH